MTDWTAGYVGDIEYLPGFYREQGPAHLDLACLIGGVRPPDPRGGLNYCELGCGQGITVLLLAAANPSGRFVGVDFNPAHIARGRAIAAAAGLDNVELLETSFADLAGPEAPALPSFDYVTMHGVYSWISVENRRAILRFLDRHVAPGGLVYVSYNAMPGWMQGAPVQRLLLEFAGMTPGRSDRAIVQGLDFLRAMQAAGARAFPDRELIERMERDLGRGRVSYLAHEYLNANWQPLYHADVARDMAEAKLSFIASASLLENYPAMTLTEEQARLVNGAADEMVGETLKDYFLARSFRRDIFVRGPRRLAPDQRERLLGRMPLSLLVPPGKIRFEITAPAGEVKMEQRLYGPAFAALAGHDVTPAEILDLPEVRGRTSGTAVELAGLLAGSGQALPVPTPGADRAAARRFNGAMLAHDLDEGRTASALAAPHAASGLHATLFEMLAYGALAAGAPPEVDVLADGAWRILAARGDSLRADGKPIEGAEANLAVLRQELAPVVADSLPLWRRLGVL